MESVFRLENIRFREFDKADRDKFISCIKDIYGSGYPYRKFLDGDYLYSQSVKGNMIIICGETPVGEIVSTSVANFITPFQKSAILMLRVVKKEYQNLGIGNAQQDCLFSKLNNIEHLYSIYADVMTHNTTSQHSLLRENFVYTGFRLHLYYNSIMLPDYPFAKKYKLSQAVMCKPIKCRSVGEIFCPDEHSRLVRGIYKKLEVDCLISTNRQQPQTETTVLSHHNDDIHNCSDIFIEKSGQDLDILIKNLMKSYVDICSQTYICYLNMKDKSCIWAYEVLKQNNFYFTGIKPLNENGEYMILTNSGTQNLNISEIKTEEDGEKLLKYIVDRKEAS